MLNKVITLTVLIGLVLAMAACAPQAAPAPTATQAPISVATKAPEATKPAASAATAPPTTTPAPAPATVKFGSTQTIADAGVYLALEKGYFKEQGINLDMINFRSVAELIAPLSTGELDVANPALSVALLSAAERGLDMKIVAGLNQQVQDWDSAWIVLRKDLWDSGRVKNPADLKGMKFGLPSVGSLSEQTLEIMLAQAGLKRGDDVEVNVVPLADQAAALSNKAIAAGYSVEPFIATGVQQGFSVKWIPLHQFFGGRAQAAFIIFGQALAKNQDLSRRWMTAYLKAARDYTRAIATGAGRDEVVKTLVKYASVKDPKLYDAMEMTYIDPNGSIDKKSIDLQYKWYVDKGLYTGKKTFDDITDLSYAEYATQKLGKQ